MKRIYFLFSALFLFFALSAQEKPAQEHLFTIVLDPGHGGHDPGASGRNSREKDINLAVALLAGKMIEENDPDTRVVYTRKKDTFVPLHQRANIANNARADLFVSIHTNAAKNRPSASGTETYVLGPDKSARSLEAAMRENSAILFEENYQERYLMDPNSVDSYILFDFIQNLHMNQSVNYAQAVQSNFRKLASRKDRGVRQAGFLVLSNAAMPSVLVELGYITNPEEERFLNSPAGRQKLANAIYRAFADFKDEYIRKTNGFLIADTDSVAEADLALTILTDTIVAADIVAISDVTVIPEHNAIVVSASDVVITQPAIPQEVLADTIFDKVVYKIQLFAVNRPANSAHFKGLENVSFYQEDGLYKYTYGEKNNLQEILALQETIKSKFPGTFIVAFHKGKKISLPEAARIIKEQEKALAERAARIEKLRAQGLTVVAPAPKPVEITGQPVIIPTVPRVPEIPVVEEIVAEIKPPTPEISLPEKAVVVPAKTPAEDIIIAEVVKPAVIEPLKINEAKPTPQASLPVNDRIVYRLQVLKSNLKFEENDVVFKGLSPINRTQDGWFYIYTYGESANMDDIEILRRRISPMFDNKATVVTFDKQTGRYVSLLDVIRIMRESRKN